MCGRFVLTADPKELIDFFGLLDAVLQSSLLRRFNVAPTQTIGVIPNRRRRHFRPARWGLIPSWAKEGTAGRPLINGRAETLASKPSFRQAFLRQRCIVPASGFYEWRHTTTGRQPFLIRPRKDPFFAFAGLWDTWRSPEGEVLPSFTIVTCPANDVMKGVHERMPVILSPRDWDRWLDPGSQMAEELGELLVPAPSEAVELVAVSSRVNSVAHDDEACMEPIDLGTSVARCRSTRESSDSER